MESMDDSYCIIPYVLLMDMESVGQQIAKHLLPTIEIFDSVMIHNVSNI